MNRYAHVRSCSWFNSFFPSPLPSFCHSTGSNASSAPYLFAGHLSSLLNFCLPNFQVSEELSHLRQQSRVPVSSATVLRRLEAERDDTQLELRQVTREEGGREGGRGGGGGGWEKEEKVKYTKPPPILNETLLLVQCMFRCGWSVRVFGSD